MEFAGERPALAVVKRWRVDTAGAIDAGDAGVHKPVLDGQGASNLVLWHSNEGEGDGWFGLSSDSTIAC